MRISLPNGSQTVNRRFYADSNDSIADFTPLSAIQSAILRHWRHTDATVNSILTEANLLTGEFANIMSRGHNVCQA